MLSCCVLKFHFLVCTNYGFMMVFLLCFLFFCFLPLGYNSSGKWQPEKLSIYT
ncbi:hypothetical protein HanLR1_Chr15g0588281 [Helianthus annuus]|nr:hypothetical protein HanLR1_Chr15g0588281 [Helianthus annuus]